jgi:hypothetical protein
MYTWEISSTASPSAFNFHQLAYTDNFRASLGLPLPLVRRGTLFACVQAPWFSLCQCGNAAFFFAKMSSFLLAGEKEDLVSLLFQ